MNGRALPDPVELWRSSRRGCESARNPVLVAGPDIDASGGWADAIALAEKQRLPVWATPGDRRRTARLPGEPSAISSACCRRRSARCPETLKEHDLVLVVGSSVFPYYPYIPGAAARPRDRSWSQITSDPDEAARAPMGDAIVGDVALALKELVELVGESERHAPDPRPAPGEPAARRPDQRLAGDGGARRRLAAGRRSPWSRRRPRTIALRNRLRLSTPGSYYFCASGGLGFGISAAVGVQLAQPRAAGRVRARRGLGAVRDHRAVDGRRLQGAGHLPRAPQRGVHDPQVVLDARAGRPGRPGSTCPGLDVAAVARGVRDAGARRSTAATS